MSLEVQFTSNLRIGIEHLKAPEGHNLVSDIPKTTLGKHYETHNLRFERYVKMPKEMESMKAKLV